MHQASESSGPRLQASWVLVGADVGGQAEVSDTRPAALVGGRVTGVVGVPDRQAVAPEGQRLSRTTIVLQGAQPRVDHRLAVTTHQVAAQVPDDGTAAAIADQVVVGRINTAEEIRAGDGGR